MLVLDTDHLSILEWAFHGSKGMKLQEKLDHSGEEVFTTIVSFEEQMRGWMAAINRKKLMKDQIEGYGRLHRQLQNFCKFRILHFDEAAATRFQELQKMKLGVATMDLKIAAIVRSQDATLLSGNLQDFNKVPGLKVENWAA